MHFPGSRLRLTLSAILPCEARTFLTVIPFGMIPRGRLTKLRWYYTIKRNDLSIEQLTVAIFYDILILILV